MKVKIGKYELLTSQTLLIHDEQEVEFELRVLHWDMKAKIRFLEDENKESCGVGIEEEDGFGIFEFTNWDGDEMSLNEPFDIAVTAGRSVYLMAFGHKVGNVLRLDLHFYLEADDE